MTPHGIWSLIEAARLRPLPVDPAQTLAALALEHRCEADALPAVEAAARAAETDAPLWQFTGLLHRALGDLAPAIAALDKALALTPRDARLMHARARAAAEAGLSSLDWYARARALAPMDGDVILGQAAALLDAGEDAAADALLDGMLREHAGWLPGHTAIARMRHALGAPDWLAAIDTAIAGAPADWRLHHLKISLLLRTASPERTRAALAAAPDAPEMAALHAIVATETGLLDEADRAFARLDLLRKPGALLHWLRHLLRREEPELVSKWHGRIPAETVHDCWPYLSAAWRMTGDSRAEWLDDPRLVKVIDLGTNWPEFAALAPTLRALHRTRADPLDQSVRSGTQTDGPLLWRIDPAIAALRRRLTAAVEDYIAGLAPNPTHPTTGAIPRAPRFSGSWSVRLSDGGYHDPHVHTQGWLSSAFYVALPPAATGSEGWLTLGQPQASLGTGLEPLRTIEPRAGRLVLFPSILWHGTLPFPVGERLTAAFDIT